MGSFTGKLLLIFVIFFYSIELISSQTSPPRPAIHHQMSQHSHMDLPPPYYYDENGRIRAHGHPNAVPVMQNGTLCGMTDRVHFFPIIVQGKMYVINLNRRRYIEITAHNRRGFLRNAENNMNVIRESCRRYNSL